MPMSATEHRNEIHIHCSQLKLLRPTLINKGYMRMHLANPTKTYSETFHFRATIFCSPFVRRTSLHPAVVIAGPTVPQDISTQHYPTFGP
jgi:hypothetical protein